MLLYLYLWFIMSALYLQEFQHLKYQINIIQHKHNVLKILKVIKKIHAVSAGERDFEISTACFSCSLAIIEVYETTFPSDQNITT